MCTASCKCEDCLDTMSNWLRFLYPNPFLQTLKKEDEKDMSRLEILRIS